MQVFTKNSNQWEGTLLEDEDIESYKSAEAKSTIAPVLAHGAYLINLCAVREDVLLKSRRALQDELRRCERLGILGLVVHPGSHMGAGEQEGIRRIAASINHVHDQTRGFRTLTILETTAGQGTAVGYTFEHLRGIIDLVRDQERTAVCIDTCHLFASGYRINTKAGWNDAMESLDAVLGLGRVVAVHVNDSKRECGSRVDRHEQIGKGLIGETAFRMLMNDPRLFHLPKILETEKSQDMHEDVENMNYLRSLLEYAR